MNKVVHFEVPFDDKDRAKKFYTDVFEWQLQDMPEMNYIMASTAPTDENFMLKEPGAINGGMYQRNENSSKTPVLVIDVPSLDSHISKVEAAGGKVIMPKTQVADMGLYAQVQDTEGNIIGLWENLKK